MPYGFVRIILFFIFFLFFRRQGFRMITFDCQAGPLQNFNRSHVMVIGRSVSLSDPAGLPKIPPSEKKNCLHAFQNPNFNFSREKNLYAYNTHIPIFDYLMQ